MADLQLQNTKQAIVLAWRPQLKKTAVQNTNQPVVSVFRSTSN